MPPSVDVVVPPRGSRARGAVPRGIPGERDRPAVGHATDLSRGRVGRLTRPEPVLGLGHSAYSREVLIPEIESLQLQGGEPHVPTPADRRPDRGADGAGQARARVRQRADHPRGPGARAQGRVPDRDRRGHEGDGDLRADDPRGVRRSRGVAAHLRAGGRGDRPRLDVGERHRQHPLHRRLHAAAARHRGAEAALPAEDGDRRDPGRLLDERAGARFRRLRDPDQGGEGRHGRRCRPVVDHRPEDVAHQRRQRESRCGAGEDGPRGRLGLQEHDDLPHRQDRRLRRDRPGRHHPRQDREDGLQGRRHHRDGARRVTRPPAPRSSAASRARASTR